MFVPKANATGVKAAMVEAPEAPHHHHHPTGIPWFDLVVPIAVLCISVASLLTSLQSEKSMHALVEENRRLVSAQSTPLLMLDSGNLLDGKPVLTMTLSNAGTGPARIGWFHLVDDKGLSYVGGDFYERLSEEHPGAPFISEVIGGVPMRSGASRTVFQWARPADVAGGLQEWEQLNHERFRLHGSACYCSMFDECKVTDFGDAPPRVVASCEQAKTAQ